MGLRKISAAEISGHCHEDDAWMVINGVVWDVTGFAAKHPGGPKIIADHVGKDGSSMYNDIHGPGLIASHLGSDRQIGVVDDQYKNSLVKETKREPSIPKPDLKSIVDLSQFEKVAEKALKQRAWKYISGATEDGVTHEANCEFYRRIFFRPQMLNGAGKIDTSTVFMGKKCAVPFFIAPTSSVKLSHPDGELALAKASVAHGVPPCLPTMSSYALPEIVDVMPPSYPFFFQLYMNLDRSQAARTLRQARDLGAQAILVTIDLPVMSKRQNIDRRQSPLQRETQEALEKKEEQTPAAQEWSYTPNNVAIDPDLQWKDIEWIRKVTGLPVILKGIQSAADAKRAFEYGCSGIYISNHGGRALDTAPPAILVLLEIHATCPEILGKLDIMIDGGVRRGSDILKAICLGANVVCIGRPFLYALSYGEAGVNHAFDILKHELETAMALLGISSLDQAHPGLVNTSLLDFMVYHTDKHPWAAYPVPRIGGSKL
ncbi:hypothetical protein DTO021D3_8154 [Paecilomyces variotii]|nr:hypothetical protein DTO032I3_4694 [Paecilomyces variotii]KAJ9225102.1 hypothetical protein DTO169C6_2443 [Paecilomyces variotii]KAJ9249955.1 hypothetical protein DTO195F2_8325 [Paecilomyces variotii]KAJ9274983.1 hypothetical protein DTO021D3_8154 [Paecilomyces variotii]KAJ9291517.1 hypothetical protein DTO021C3_874 [Paecilomyces variotii]